MADTRSSSTTPVLTVLRVLVVLALASSAYAHWRLAHTYDPVGKGGFITQGRLFRLQGTAAGIAAVLLVIRSNVISWGLAFGVMAASAAAIFTYRYANIGKIGPIPDMYEPTWQSIKTWGVELKPLSAIAGLVGSAAGLVGVASHVMPAMAQRRST